MTKVIILIFWFFSVCNLYSQVYLLGYSVNKSQNGDCSYNLMLDSKEFLGCFDSSNMEYFYLGEDPVLQTELHIIIRLEKNLKLSVLGFLVKGTPLKKSLFSWEKLEEKEGMNNIDYMACYLFYEDLRALNVIKKHMDFCKKNLDNELDQDDYYTLKLFIDAIEMFKQNGKKPIIFDMKNSPIKFE